MKYIITESQYNRLISEESDESLASRIEPETLSKIIRNFDKLQELNCDEVDHRSYDTPFYVKIFCKQFKGRNIEDVERVKEMSLMLLSNHMSDANDRFIKSFK